MLSKLFTAKFSVIKFIICVLKKSKKKMFSIYSTAYQSYSTVTAQTRICEHPDTAAATTRRVR